MVMNTSPAVVGKGVFVVVNSVIAYNLHSKTTG